MAKLPFQLLIKHTSSKKHAESSTYSRLKKCLRTSKRHLQIKAGSYIAMFDRGFCQDAESLEFIEKIDTLMDKGRILKDGDTCYVSCLTWNSKDVVVKRYNHKGFIHSLRHTIKRSRARRGWLHGHRLGMLNIATPRPLAYIEQRRGLLVWQSYLVTEYVKGQKLYDFLRDDNVAEQRQLKSIQQVMKLLGKLWRYRITHGDLKHTNILITENGPVLTDLDATIVHRWGLLYRNKRAKDMERFLKKTGISPALNNYCQLLISSKMDFRKKLADDFDKMRMDNWIIRIRKDFPKDDIRNLISVNDSPAEGQGQFTRVPSSNYTHVFRLNISFNGVSHTLYLKKYLYRSTLDFVKHLFRPSRAKRAFNASLMLQKNGFDAPTVIGLFERCLGPFRTDNMLLVKSIEDSKPLYECISQFHNCTAKKGLQEKRRLITSFGETVGRMHAAGIFHGDLRLGNVLVQKNEGQWRFFFIDNERTKKFYHLPDSLRLKNLVQVNMFQYGIGNTDRLRFFKEYWAENRSIKKQKIALIKKVLRKTNQRLSKKRKVSRELRKCLRKNARYLRIKTGRYIAVFDRAFCLEAKPFDFIEQIDALMDKGQILKNGDTSYVSRLTWNDKDVVVKRYNHRGFIHSLRHTIKRSRARRSWLHGHRLGMLDIATPKPLAYIEQHRSMLVWKSYLVTEHVKGQELKHFLRDDEIGDEKRAMVTQQVTDLLGKLGQYHITHGDLKHSNVLITESGPVLTDLDSMRVHKWTWLFKVKRNKDMARLTKDWKSDRSKDGNAS